MWTDVCTGPRGNSHNNEAFDDPFYSSIPENNYEAMKDKEPAHTYSSIADEWSTSESNAIKIALLTTVQCLNCQKLRLKTYPKSRVFPFSDKDHPVT